MTNAKVKNSGNNQSVTAFIASVENDKRRSDAERLLKIFKSVTGLKAKMWGTSIIGFGRYHYKYESGREGDSMMTGFSPRKANSVIYVMPGYQDLSKMLERLGKHKIGKSCLYINKLDDIDETVLREIILFGLENIRLKYQTFDD